jgi:hypothetical protein
LNNKKKFYKPSLGHQKLKDYSWGIALLKALAPARQHNSESSLILETSMSTVRDFVPKNTSISLLPNFPSEAKPWFPCLSLVYYLGPPNLYGANAMPIYWINM